MFQTAPGIWIVSLVLGVVCAILLAGSIASETVKRALPWSGPAAGKLAIIVVATFVLVFPIAAFDKNSQGAVVWVPVAESVPAAIYETAQVLVLQVSLDSWSLEVFEYLGHGAFGEIYFWLVTFFAIACPIALAMTAIDVIINGFSGFSLWYHSLRKALFRRTIYVFYGFDDNTVTLARDLLDHTGKSSQEPSERFPLLVFTNVSGESEASGESFTEEVREAAQGIGDVLVTPLVLEDVPRHLARAARRRCQTNYLLISNDTTLNVRTTIRLCDTFTEELMGLELERVGWDPTRIRDLPDISEATRNLAAHIHVWCTHTNPDDDLVFDSLPHRGPSDAVMERLIETAEQRAEPYHHPSRTAIAQEILPLESRIRSLFEVRLIFEERQVIWDALIEHPLTEVLKPIDIAHGPAPHQLLYVVVIGLSATGMEAVRAAFWFARLPGVELRIVGVDGRAAKTLTQLATAAPAMVGEARPQGAASVGAVGAGPRIPVVRFVAEDPASPTLETLLSGGTVSALQWDDGAITEEPLAIEDSAAVYCMVCAERDSLSVDLALRAQRALANRTLTHRSASSVSLFIRDQELSDSIAHLTDGDERFPIAPFGATSRTFSYESVFAAPWEQAALNLQAAKDAAFSLGHGGTGRVSMEEAIEAYNSLEVRKLDNRAAVHHAIYRLWCLGLDKGSADSDLAQSWAAKLGAADVVERARARDPEALACLCGIAYERLGLDDESRALRSERALASLERASEAWPALSTLAMAEHSRWVAFLKAQGWQGFADFGELERAMRMVGSLEGRAVDSPWPLPHRSTRLKRHYYLVDDPACKAARGAECLDDPMATDRLVVLETIRSLRAQIVG